jgi:hypothetical protein
MPIILSNQNLINADINSENYAYILQLSYLIKIAAGAHTKNQTHKIDNTRNTLETPVWGKLTKRGFYYGLSRELTTKKNQKFLLSKFPY